MALAGFLSTAASCLYVNKVARLTILPQTKRINQRLGFVTWLLVSPTLRQKLRKALKKLRKTNKACTASDVILGPFLKSLVLSVGSPCLWTPGESVTATRKALLAYGIMNHEWWKNKICGYHMMLPGIVLNQSPLLCFLKIAGRHGVAKQSKGIN